MCALVCYSARLIRTYANFATALCLVAGTKYYRSARGTDYTWTHLLCISRLHSSEQHQDLKKDQCSC